MTPFYGSWAQNWVNSVSGFEVSDDPVTMSQSELNYDKGKGGNRDFFLPEKLMEHFRRAMW